MGSLHFNLAFLQFLAEHRNFLLTDFFRTGSLIGSAASYVLIIMLIYVVWDKQLAMRTSVLMLLASPLNDILKMIIRNPRPFVRQGTYRRMWAVSAEQAKALAAEYSTPSGHAMGAATFYSYLYAFVRKRWLRTGCVLMILWIGSSRPYLGVHYAEDVLLGWGIGVCIAILAVRWTVPITAFWGRRSLAGQMALAVLISAALSLTVVMLNAGRLDSQSRPMLSFAGLLTGNVLARRLELSRINFDPRSRGALAKLLRYLVTIGMMLAVMQGLKPLFAVLAAPYSMPGFFLEYLRSTAAGFAGMYLAPWLFTRMNLAEVRLAGIG